MLRIVGVFEKPVAAMAVGVTLCVATVSVFVAALVLSNTDRLNEKRAELLDLQATVELTTAESNEETGEKQPGEAGSESPANETKIEQDATGEDSVTFSSSHLVATSPEDTNFLLGMLCVVGQTQPDDGASATATSHTEEVARLQDENKSLREELAVFRQEKGGQQV